MSLPRWSTWDRRNRGDRKPERLSSSWQAKIRPRSRVFEKQRQRWGRKGGGRWRRGGSRRWRGAAAQRRCRSAVHWPDGPDGAVSWRPHSFLRSHALALRGSGAAALVGGGRMDVARKGRRVLMRCRRRRRRGGGGPRRGHGDADERRGHGDGRGQPCWLTTTAVRIRGIRGAS